MKPLELRGESELLGYFAHIRIAPMLADPRAVVTAYEGGVSLRVEIPIYDRDDGARWTVATTQNMAAGGFSWRHGDPREVAEGMVRTALKAALCHEVDECLRDAAGGWLGGDPHGRKVRPGEEA